MNNRTVEAQFKSATRTAINLLLMIVCALVVLYALSGIYSIENNEVGVLQRFGKIIDSNVPPGIHYAFPWPVDRVNKVPFPKVERIHLQDFSQNFSFGAQGISFTSLTGLGTYAITGDNNLVNLECILQYEVRDPVAYLFRLGESLDSADATTKRFLIELASNSIIHCLAEIGVDDVLTNWERIVSNVKEKLQQRLNDLESGLAVTFVEIKELRPPVRVQEFFDDVINAKIDKEKAINDAESYNKQELPAARGRAVRMRSEAEGYYSEAVQNAHGETQRFLNRLSEYRKDPGLTRYRLYMETVQELLAGVGKLHLVDTANGEKPASIRLVK